MNFLKKNKRTLMVIALLAPVLILFIYAVLRSGPLAPVPVTAIVVEKRAIAPALFGIGIVEARFMHKIGPTVTGRVQRVDVDVNDRVHVGQQVAELDPVDLDAFIVSGEAATKNAEAKTRGAQAHLKDTAARKDYAEAQINRYDTLFKQTIVSRESLDEKKHDYEVSQAGYWEAEELLEAAEQDLLRLRADYQALLEQRGHLKLVSPVDGLVVSRDADPGSTVVAGHAVVQVLNPAFLWVNVRFDQVGSASLRAGLPARISLRSRPRDSIAGRVLRVEPLADTVTEEMLVKVAFDTMPDPLPYVGELAEVTVALAEEPETTVVPNASLHRVDGVLGVWVIEQDALRFRPVAVGASDLDGTVQVVEGLQSGETVVVYSYSRLHGFSRFTLVERLPGVQP